MYNALPFEEDVHDIKDKEWCPMQQEYQASDQIHWFIYKVTPHAQRPIAKSDEA